MALITKTIKASGGDYTSLAAWEDAMDGNLTTNHDISEAVCYSLDDTTYVPLSGWTTAAGDYIYIHTDTSARHAGVWNGDLYNLVTTNSNAIDITENYVRIDGLQIGLAGVNADYQCGLYIVGQDDVNSSVRISNNIIKNSGATTYEEEGIYANDAQLNLYCWNNIFYGLGVHANNYHAAIYVNNGTYYFYSNTLVSGHHCLYAAGGTVTAKNCYGAETGGGAAFTGVDTMVTCGSSDATGSVGLQSIAYGTDTFINVSAGSENLHLAADGLSPLQGAGTDTSGDADPLNFTTDIDGQTRDATWDIGADAWYVAPAEGYINELCLIFEC